MNDILTDDDARGPIVAGINKVANAVGKTAGPKGKNVAIAQGFGASTITNDGVTVARSISLSDPQENIGAHMVKEVATNTEDSTGDGTTTATLLFQSLVREGIKMLATGADPNRLKVGIALAVDRIIDALDSMAIKVSTDDVIRKVATISANNDPILGELIAEAFHEAGEAGEVAVTDSESFETYLQVVDGLRFDKGYLHRAFINNTRFMRADIPEAKILVTDKRINATDDLIPIIEKIGETDNNKLVVISDEVAYEVLEILALSKLQGKINVTCIKAPGYGDSRCEMLEDIAAIVGATFIGSGINIRTISEEDLGYADNVYAGKDETTIVGGHGEKELIQSRIDNIKMQLEEPKLDDHARKTLQKRLTYLKGGVSVLYVGADSDTELTEKKFRIEDAIGATRSAIKEGVVPGCGLALVAASGSIADISEITKDTDEQMGVNIVLRSITAPFNKIVSNAGLSPETVMGKISLGKGVFFGLNVKTGEYGDLLELGVIDPVKVTKAALRNAASVASTFLTIDAVVLDKKED